MSEKFELLYLYTKFFYFFLLSENETAELLVI
jgi:hypothetical protein